MERGYQHGYSDTEEQMFNVKQRRRKANTMVAVLSHYYGQDLESLTVLNVGGSAGIIDEVLAEHFAKVISIDIDEKAIEYAQDNFNIANVEFQVGDAMKLGFEDQTFDVVICSHVYEHVPDSKVMMNEIHRVLKAGGVCYFAAGNRLMWNEPHYNLPLLSVLPRPLAHLYIRMAGKASFYYEKHLSYWGLKSLVRQFSRKDYTKTIIEDPEAFGAEYMVKPNTKKQKIAVAVASYALWLVPGYIWILKKNNSN